jgi:hypothetical protein
MEIALGDKVGPTWGKWIKYAKRRGWFGPRVQIRDLDDVEKELRDELDRWIAQRNANGASTHDDSPDTEL